VLVDSPNDRRQPDAAEEGAMKKLIPYKRYVLEPNSYKLSAGGWVPRAWVIMETEDEVKMHPVYSKTKTRLTQDEADEYAIELGKLWVDKNG
jgi:hypothetical protein